MRRSASMASCLLLLALVAMGCGDDPFQIDWSENPLEAELFSLDREELNRPSAFDMLQRRRVVVESAQTQSQWDFAVDRLDGRLVLLPPRALGVESRAGIATVPGITFEDLRDAPSDSTLYVTREAVPVEHGMVYVIQTRQQTGRFGQRCRYYGKLEPVRIDQEAGVLVFRHDTSPECNSRRLVPPGS